MKTLDEVIKTMDHVEFCCMNCKLQFDCDEVECFLEDALHYLKEYRTILPLVPSLINTALAVQKKGKTIG